MTFRWQIIRRHPAQPGDSSRISQRAGGHSAAETTPPLPGGSEVSEGYSDLVWPPAWPPFLPLTLIPTWKRQLPGLLRMGRGGFEPPTLGLRVARSHLGRPRAIWKIPAWRLYPRGRPLLLSRRLSV